MRRYEANLSKEDMMIIKREEHEKRKKERVAKLAMT